MTPQQALELIVNAARQARLNYQEHAAVDRAAQLLQKAVGADAPPVGRKSKKTRNEA